MIDIIVGLVGTAIAIAVLAHLFDDKQYTSLLTVKVGMFMMAFMLLMVSGWVSIDMMTHPPVQTIYTFNSSGALTETSNMSMFYNDSTTGILSLASGSITWMFIFFMAYFVTVFILYELVLRWWKERLAKKGVVKDE